MLLWRLISCLFGFILFNLLLRFLFVKTISGQILDKIDTKKHLKGIFSTNWIENMNFTSILPENSNLQTKSYDKYRSFVPKLRITKKIKYDQTTIPRRIVHEYLTVGQNVKVTRHSEQLADDVILLSEERRKTDSIKCKTF